MKIKSILLIVLAFFALQTLTNAQTGSYVSTGQKKYKFLETTSNSSWVSAQLISDAASIISDIQSNDSFCLVATHHISDIYALSLPWDLFQYYFMNAIPTATINRDENFVKLNKTNWQRDVSSFGINNPKYMVELFSFKNVSETELKFNVRGTGLDTINQPLNLNVYIIEDNVQAGDGRTHNNVVREMLGGPWGRNVTNQVLRNQVDTTSFLYTIPVGVNHRNLKFIAVASVWDGLSIENREVVNCIESDFSRILLNDTFFTNSDTQCLNTNQFLFKDLSPFSNLYSRKWILSNNASDTSSEAEVIKSFQSVGTYTVKMVRQYIYGYNDTITKQIVVISNPQAGSVAGITNNLQIGIPYLYNINQQLGMTYNWIVNNAAIVSGQGTNAITIQWLNNGIGTLKCIIYNTSGCTDTASLTVGIGTLPTITSFSPTSAATNQTVNIYGVNLTGTTGVKFGGVNAQSFTVVSSTLITAVVGTGATGLVSIENPSGNASLAGFTFMGTTNTINLLTSSGIEVYPNPAHNVLNVKFTKNGTHLIILTDNNGKIYSTHSTTGVIDVSSLANGIYILHVLDDNDNIIYKDKVSIIKE